MFVIALLVAALSNASPLAVTNPAQPAGGGSDGPTAPSPGDDDIERELAQITSGGANFGGGLDFNMFMKVSYAYSDGTALLGGAPISRLSINDVHFNVDGEFDHWLIHVGLRGEADSGLGFFGDAGTVGEVRAFDVLLSHEVVENWWIRAGQFHPPFLGSALYEDNQLLFVDRTYNGEIWDFYDQGAMLEGHVGMLRGWASIQNGLDGSGNEYAVTGRGMIDLLGEGTGYDHEGALGAPPGPQLSLGGAAYYDSNTTNASSQALEGHFTLDRFCAEAELVDNGNGLGNLYSWSSTASFLVTDTIELAARYEAFRRADDTQMWTFGVDKYIAGHAVKWQAEMSSANSHAPRADTTVFQVALVVSL